MPKRAALFHSYPSGNGDVYGQGRRERLEELTDLDLSHTTPMEALLRLHQWKQELTESQSGDAAEGTRGEETEADQR